MSAYYILGLRVEIILDTVKKQFSCHSFQGTSLVEEFRVSPPGSKKNKIYKTYLEDNPESYIASVAEGVKRLYEEEERAVIGSNLNYIYQVKKILSKCL